MTASTSQLSERYSNPAQLEKTQYPYWANELLAVTYVRIAHVDICAAPRGVAAYRLYKAENTGALECHPVDRELKAQTLDLSFVGL